jgi:magnesium-transporting ATPase (P-type)
MLWTNLIMDILGAIAMCTEPYNPNHQGSRISRKSQIILPEMWRQILVQAAYQIFVMVILMYFGQFIFFDKSFNLIMEKKRNKDSSPTDRLILDTMIFHTFILMNLFNQINCRIVEANEINIFKTLSPLRHPMFWIVIIFEVFVQQTMINMSET